MAIIIDAVEKKEYYTLVRVRGTLDEIRAARSWCLTTECGKQVNMHTFSFRRDEDLTMFKLKWENNNT
jgi:hypothetical protein